MMRRLVATAAIGVAALQVLRNVSALRAVAADLRSPLLYVPLAPSSSGYLRVMRRLVELVPPPRHPDGVRSEDRTAAVAGRVSTRVVVYERPDRERPTAALLWMHGGGTVIGRAEAPAVARWADDLGILIVSVDYRLAPEHPYPAGLEDCYTALAWLHHCAQELGVDPERIAVGGESAGGLLAASLCLLARERGGPPVSFQLLEYPMLDDRTVLRPDPGRSRSFVWSPRSSRFAWTSYLGGPPTEDDERAAAPARVADLSGLPPAWIGVGDVDLLHEEAVSYAARLRQAGVACDLHVEPGMHHGAPSLKAKAPTSKRFRDRETDALASGLGLAR